MQDKLLFESSSDSESSNEQILLGQHINIARQMTFVIFYTQYLRESPDEQPLDMLSHFSDDDVLPVSVLKVLFSKIFTQIQSLEERFKVEKVDSDQKSPMCLSECQEVDQKNIIKIPFNSSKNIRTQKKSISGIFQQEKGSQSNNKKSMSARKPPIAEEFYVNRLNMQDKKFKQIEERINKISKDFDILTRKLDSKYEQQIKSIQQFQQQQEKSDVNIQVSEVASNQKILISHIHQLVQDQTEIGNLFHQFREEQLMKWNSLEKNAHQEVSDKNLLQEELNQWKLTISSIESDLIIILRNYKDMLNELFKLQLMGEDVRQIQQMLAKF